MVEQSGKPQTSAGNTWVTDRKMSGMIPAVHALLTFTALSYNLEKAAPAWAREISALKVTGWNLLYSFHSFTLAHFMLLPGIWLMFTAIARMWEKDGGATLPSREGRKIGFTIHGPAILFAAMMVFGWSFSRYDSCAQVLTVRDGQLIKSFLVGLGLYFLFRYLIQFVYLKFASGFGRMRKFGIKTPGWLAWYKKRLSSAPFLTSALTLLFFYIPYLLISYPGIASWDTYSQIAMTFPELKYTSFYVDTSRLPRPGVYLNAHHPVIHTMLLHYCLAAGKRLLGSWNRGFYLYSALQAAAFICAAAYAIRQYVRKHAATTRFVLWTILYMAVHPMVHNYLMLATKDTLYASFLILTVCAWIRVLTEKERKPFLLLMLFSAGTMLFRNEGCVVLGIAAAGSFLLNRQARKRMIILLVYIVVFMAAFTRLLLPAAGVTPGSRREMLSVPLQQTARYVIVHEDEVTEGEKNSLNAVMEYDRIRETYNPVNADGIKGTYREKAAGKDLIGYFRTWIKMGLKHPVTYLSAFLNLKYDFFYPDEAGLELQTYEMSASAMALTNRYTEKIGLTLAYPEITGRARELADDLWKWLTQRSPFSWLTASSLYPWLTVLCFCYSLRRRDGVLISLSLIPAAVLLMCLAGPLNGNYGRYTYPLLVILPFYYPLIRQRQVLPAGEPGGQRELPLKNEAEAG